MTKRDELSKLVDQAKIVLNKLSTSVVVVPEQTVFNVSVIDNKQISSQNMVNHDSLQVDLGYGFLILKFNECVGSTQYLSLYFTKEPLYKGGGYDS